VIGPPDPAEQLTLCAGLSDPADAAACVRGTKVQNLLGRDDADFVGLVERCAQLPAGARHACTRWLGRVLAGRHRRRLRARRLPAPERCPSAARVRRGRRARRRGARDLQLASGTVLARIPVGGSARGAARTEEALVRFS